MSHLQTPHSTCKPAYQHEQSPSQSSVSQYFYMYVTGLMQQTGMVMFEKTSWRLAAVFIFVLSMGRPLTVFVQRGPNNCQNRISRWFIHVGSSFLPRMFSVFFFPLCRINRLYCFQHWKSASKVRFLCPTTCWGLLANVSPSLCSSAELNKKCFCLLMLHLVFAVV